MVGIGLISYSAYLWHQPLFAFARLTGDNAPAQSVMAMLALAAMGLGYLSWRFVERPFRNRQRFSFPFLAKASLVMAVLFVMAGLFLQSDTATRLWLSGQPLRTRQVMALIDTATHQADYGRGADQRQDDGRCRFNVTNLTPEIGRRLLACQASNGPGVLVFGDSHAIDLFGEMASRTPQPFLVGLTQSWCRPHSPSQQCQYEEIMHFVASHPQVFHHAVFEQAGFYLLHNPQHEIGRDILLNFGLKDRVKGIDPDNANIAADVGYLRHLATQVPIVWFGPRLDLMIGRSEMVGRGCDFPYQIRPGLAETYARLDGELAQQAATAPGVTYVSQIRTMHFAVPQDLLDCRRLLWSDTDHYSAAGEVEFGLRLPPLWDLAAVRAVALPPQPDRKRQPRP